MDPPVDGALLARLMTSQKRVIGEDRFVSQRSVFVNIGQLGVSMPSAGPGFRDVIFGKFFG